MRRQGIGRIGRQVLNFRSAVMPSVFEQPEGVFLRLAVSRRQQITGGIVVPDPRKVIPAATRHGAPSGSYRRYRQRRRERGNTRPLPEDSTGNQEAVLEITTDTGSIQHHSSAGGPSSPGRSDHTPVHVSQQRVGRVRQLN